MKTIALVLLCAATSTLNAQPLSGCKPAVEAAMSLAQTAQSEGNDAAELAWQDIRDFQNMPVWHEVPLEQLMQTALSTMSEQEVRSFVESGCATQFELFARDAGEKLSKILANTPQQPQQP